MQLMPATAQEQAGKIGLSYSPSSLSDPNYNIRLGSSYFQRLLGYYGGSYPLAIAAYNAGPGTVNKWIAQTGNTRLPGVDVLRLFETNPLYQNKNNFPPASE